MESERMLAYVMFIVVPIFAMIVYISLSGQFAAECKTEASGTSLSIIGSLGKCASLCWSKHNFGQDTYSDDCFIVTVYTKNAITRSEMENFFGSTAKVYFDSLDSNSTSKIKVRYNSTGKEISLIFFEKI